MVLHVLSVFCWKKFLVFCEKSGESFSGKFD